MSNKVVIGLGFGDEGKGVTTEYLASQDPKNTIVVRFSGGQQAGHQVNKGGVSHIFANFGSGTLSGCPTYWSQHCTFDPFAFWKEFGVLMGKRVVPKAYIHPDCAVTTIFDVLANRRGTEVKHGTCGAGFFKTKNRHFNDGVRLTVKDLLERSFPLLLAEDLMSIREYYKTEDDTGLDEFITALKCVKEGLESGFFEVTPTIPDYKHKVFEGSQGLMLDEHIGTMPHCTPSDVTPRKAIELAGGSVDEVFVVTRSYQTRHGNGPMTNESWPVSPVNNEKETNVFHKYQGEFRTTILDLDQLRHAKVKGVDEVVPKDTKVNLVVTCMDQLPVYQYTYWSNGAGTKDREEFVRTIGEYLKINGDLYFNDSPESHLTKLSK